jgi:PIN domain nuclease of toxin-antitoxin system
VSILIDTDVFLWAAGLERPLPSGARELLSDANNPVFLSVASAWEIAIKWSKGRLDLPKKPLDFVQETVAAGGISQLVISMRDACAVGDLPLHHNDPFDRLLVAQAINHGLRLMTADSTLERYDVDVIALWADDDE